MTADFVVLSILSFTGAVAAVSLRNLVHCALALAVAFAGLAGLYLHLNAQFVGFAQILVYVGAVAILIVFAILLTRGGDPVADAGRSVWSWLPGVGLAAAVSGLIAAAVLGSRAISSASPSPPVATVRTIGEQLMTRYVLPLELMGLLLTAALIGAVIVAMSFPGRRCTEPKREPSTSYSEPPETKRRAQG